MRTKAVETVSVASPNAPCREGTYSCQAMGNHEIDFNTCQGTTTLPARNGNYCRGCACAWRHCTSCIIQGDTEDPRVLDPETGRCQFHKENGSEAVRGKPAPARTGPNTRLTSPPQSRTVIKAVVQQKLVVVGTEAKSHPATDTSTRVALARIANRMPKLNERRQQLLALLAKGLSNTEIAKVLRTNSNNVGVQISMVASTLEVPPPFKGTNGAPPYSRREMLIDAWRLHMEK